MSETMVNRTHSGLVINYLTLRRLLGILGILFPFILWLGSMWFGCAFLDIQDSISEYYHTRMRNVFVGVLFAMGIFLFSYNGASRKERRAGWVGGISAICTALFPTAPNSSTTSSCNVSYAFETITIGMFEVHLIFALILFLTLAYFSIVLFPDGKVENQKSNRVYKICGWLMILCIVLIGIYFAVGGTNSSWSRWRPIFWLETFALILFGISWLTKGEILELFRKNRTT